MHEPNIQLDQNPTSRGIGRIGAIIQERRLTKQLFGTEEFQIILQEFKKDLDDQSGSKLWIALSIAGRASSVSKPAEAIFLPLIKQRLSKKLPEWIDLEDGEERYYLAKALQYAPNKIIVDHAFSQLAREEVAEKARRIWANIAFEDSKSREEFLTRLNGRIAEMKREEKLSIESLIRRLRRINSAIVESIATAEKPIGSGFGDALHKFYVGYAIVNGPNDRELREESAIEFSQSLVEIIRLNYRAAFDPSIYNILAAFRNWWKPASPPNSFEVVSRRVAIIGVDAVHFFVQRGTKNKHLRNAIVKACGRSVVGVISKKVVNEDISLPEDLAYWLVHGEEQISQRSTAAIEALSAKGLDEYIGHLLIHVSSPDIDSRMLQFTADQIRILIPEEAEGLLRAANSLSQVAQWSRAVARSRNIELISERGQIVAYDPTVHVARDDCVVDADAVVVNPGAIRKLDGRPQVLVVKIEVRKR